MIGPNVGQIEYRPIPKATPDSREACSGGLGFHRNLFDSLLELVYWMAAFQEVTGLANRKRWRMFVWRNVVPATFVCLGRRPASSLTVSCSVHPVRVRALPEESTALALHRFDIQRKRGCCLNLSTSV